MEITAASSGHLELARAWARAFAQWWLSGLRETIPPDWLDWADRAAMPKLTLWRDDQGVVCALACGGRLVEARLPRGDAATLGDWLSQNGLSRDEITLGLVMPREQFFVRDLTVPKAALSALPKILEQEVLRRTPFELSDIWHGTTAVNTTATDVCVFAHWIIRKDRAQTALEEVGLSANDVDFLASRGADGDTVDAISLQTSRGEDAPWAARVVRLLGLFAIAVTILGLVAFEWFQASVATSLEAALVEMRQGAQVGQDGADPTGRLLAMKSTSSMLEIWDELSRILPDDTFLTQLRVADGKIALAGLSSDAGRLVRVIDRSPLFSGATLDGAMTPDSNEHKDRFSIRFKLRVQPLAQSAVNASGRP